MNEVCTGKWPGLSTFSLTLSTNLPNQSFVKDATNGIILRCFRLAEDNFIIPLPHDIKSVFRDDNFQDYSMRFKYLTFDSTNLIDLK